MNTPENPSSIQYPVSLEAAGFVATPLPFSLATQFGNLIFISGQASVDANGAIVDGTFEEEFRRSMENVRRILQAAGSDLHLILQVRSYVRDAVNLGEYNRLYKEYFEAPFPARTTLTGCLPESLHFEIEVVAVKA